MTQTSGTARGFNRPALALALGSAAAATVLAPVAAMATSTSPTPSSNLYNDILSDGTTPKALGTHALPTIVKFGGTTAATQTRLTKPLPASAVPASLNDLTTIRGVVFKQAVDASASKRTALDNAYKAWRTAATPVVSAYIAYHNAKTAAAKASALKNYNAKLAIYNKKATGATNNGPAKWTTYSNAFNAWSALYKTQLAAVQSNHFQLAAKSSFVGTCTSADNRQASFFTHSTTIVDAPGAVGEHNPATGAGYALWCDTSTGKLNYYLPNKNPGSGFESFNEAITTDPITGKVTDVSAVTDATGDSLGTYIGFFFNSDGITAAVHASPLAPVKRSDISAFATKAISAPSGAYMTASQTCVSAAAGATLTCQAFTESLQNALNSAYAVSPK